MAVSVGFLVEDPREEVEVAVAVAEAEGAAEYWWEPRSRWAKVLALALRLWVPVVAEGAAVSWSVARSMWALVQPAC